MENQTTNFRLTFVAAVSKISAVLLLAIALIGSVPDDVQAQGKLGRARAAVRKHQPSPPSRPERPSREEPNDNHDNDDDHDHESRRPLARRDDHRISSHIHNNRRRNPHGSRSSGIVFFSPPQRCIEPIVIPVVADYTLAPVETIYAPVVAQSQPTPQPTPQPTQFVESVVVSSPLDAELGAPIPASAGDSYFEFGPSKFWATVGSDFDGITTGGLGLNLQSENGPGLDTSVMIIRESVGGFRDHFWVGDVNLVYEVISSDFLRGRVGLGVNWLSDAWGAEAGFNLTAGLDARLTERLTLSAEADLGNLGDADFFHGRVNLARRFEACDWIVGADHFDFGGAEVTNYFTGIQFRF